MSIVSPDIADNVTGSPLNPQNWNLYSYVRGNPVNMNDPTGHEGETSQQKVVDPNYTPQAGEKAANEEVKEEGEKPLKGAGDQAAKENLSIVNPVTGERSMSKEEIRNDSSGSGEYKASRTTVASGTHDAIDQKAPIGTSLVAPVSGKVIDNPYIKPELAGINVTIETTTDKGTRVVASMSHLQSKSVKAGDMVTQGEVIAKSGNSGNAGKTTPHVHFSISYGKGKGEPLNPMNVINNQGF